MADVLEEGTEDDAEGEPFLKRKPVYGSVSVPKTGLTISRNGPERTGTDRNGPKRLTISRNGTDGTVYRRAIQRNVLTK